MSLLGPTFIDGPRGPDGKPQGPAPLGWKISLGLLGIILGSFISNLDTRLTTFSLQDLRGGTGYGEDEASWIATAYNVAEIFVVPVTAWLASIVSQRRAAAAAVALLTLAGVLCPWAAKQGYVWLVAMRFLQGLGGGALIPLLLGILLRFLPLHQRIFGFAIYALVTASTPLVSESLAGVLTDSLDWQSIFYVGAALGPLVMFLLLIGLPLEPAKPELFRNTDYVGMLLLVLWPSLLTAALGVGQRLNWFSSPLVVSLFVSSALLLAAFVLTELTLEKPVFNLRLLAHLNFSGGLLAIFAFSFATLMTSSVLPQFGAEVRGFRESQIGAILIWAALAQVVVCAVAPFLLWLLEARIVLAIGLLIATLGSWLATYVTSQWALVDILPSHLIQACGQPLIMVPLIVISTSTLKPEDSVSGSTLFNIARSLAAGVSGAVVGAILTVRERVHSNTIVDHLTAGAPATVQAQAAGGLVAAVKRQATTMAAADAYGWIGVVTLSAMVLAAVLSETKLFRAPSEARRREGR